MSDRLTGEDRSFIRLVRDFYRDHGRDMPWRRDLRPYGIFVSEVMLQQTQVSRVTGTFLEFTRRFPDFETLAAAPFGEVLASWSGLGYNRRARYLHDAAKIVASRPGGLPESPEELKTLPGIGPNTAGSIAAFAFNAPVVFIETNIRRVFLHHFFQDDRDVHDRLILPLVEKYLDRENPREWYWALMDYGSELGKRENANRRSRHYVRQSPFERSDRQLRGRILRVLAEHRSVVAEELPAYTDFPEPRVRSVLQGLLRDRLIEIDGEGGIDTVRPAR